MGACEEVGGFKGILERPSGIVGAGGTMKECGKWKRAGGGNKERLRQDEQAEVNSSEHPGEGRLGRAATWPVSFPDFMEEFEFDGGPAEFPGTDRS